MAFYLKYRSQTVNDLDIAPVREALTRILQAKETPHALLFSGPKGTGKTSAARILAKAVNCENRIVDQTTKKENKKENKTKTSNLKASSPSSSPGLQSSISSEPCNHCAHCTSITAGSHLDVLEIDAASHRGIDDIRDLRERINLAPADSRYRVYIIDEVHMLTPEAFNALLKTLEEPPVHAIFVLCTTEPQKLLGTIISRCTQVIFRKANQSEILRSLKRVIQGENINISDQALAIIAQQSDGSFRDALKLLEQLSSSSQEITPEYIQQQIGLLSQHQVSELLTLFHQRHTSRILSWIEQSTSDGADLFLITRQALQLLHQALLDRYGLSVEEDLEFLKLWSNEDLRQLTHIFNRVVKDTKTAIIPQLPLEIAAVEWCQSPVQSNSSKTSASSNPSSVTTPSENLSYPQKLNKDNSQPEQSDKSDSKTNPQPLSNSIKPPDKLIPPSDLSFQSVTDQWPQVLASVRPKNHSVEGLLRATRPKAINGSDLVLEVFYEFHLNQLRAEAKRILIEQSIQEVFNTQLNLIFQLGERPPAPPKPKTNFQPQEFSQRPASSSAGPPIKPSPLASPSEQEQDLAAIAAEIFGA